MAHTNYKFPPFSIALPCIVAGNFDDPFPFPFPFPFPPFTVAPIYLYMALFCQANVSCQRNNRFMHTLLSVNSVTITLVMLYE